MCAPEVDDDDLTVELREPGTAVVGTVVQDLEIGDRFTDAGLLLRALLNVLAAQGRMILFSTHRFDMAARLCSRVLMLSAGRIVHEATIAELPAPAADALEAIFVKVTEQADYDPLAREIFDVITVG